MTKNILIILSLLSFVGAGVYKLYSLNNLGVFISCFIVLVIYIIILLFNQKYNKKVTKIKKKNELNISTSKKTFSLNLILGVTYLFFLFLCFFYLVNSQTDNSVISPWQVVSKFFFLSYFLATLLLIINIFFNKKACLIFIILHYFLSFSVVLIVYKIGYGFDSFIHQSTVDLIDKTGAVNPKPFYYLGQYSLIIILHKLSFTPLVWLDKLLIPVLAAIFLPFSLFKLMKKWFNDEKKTKLSILLLLIIPFSIFIVTTPQNLAWLFLLLVLIYSLNCSCTNDLILIYLLALAALVTQPVAGIPALIFAIILTIYHSDNKNLNKLHYALTHLLMISAIPLSFYYFGNNGSGGDTSNSSLTKSLFSLPKIIIPDQENFILNFIYLYALNLKTIICLIVLAGIFIALRYKKECKIYIIFLSSSLSLFLSYILTKLLPFDFLISYERSNYADRILLTSSLFLLPFFLITIYWIINRILEKNKIIISIFIIFFTTLVTTSLYISYPRLDNYLNSHGYSVGQNDIDAVKWINDNAEKENYIVLANQQVSAAALREYGFKKYYKNDIFYYPIPTGGLLYQYYLDMVYKNPDKKTMENAMELAGVNESYFVLNKYWWAFSKIADEAKLYADFWYEINNGEIIIFKYIK